ncbi:Rossmann-like and DUF2520 domain-containing protein [Demequina oxidasica]|uniref:Rossmann-like and DUF2520 domain-containing protein n=1 Tax=Demequina oxidasica TaxID=676199 RepID=UPI000781F288|nr:DUF2520 domain-containing protein [Demequina oxidasica]
MPGDIRSDAVNVEDVNARPKPGRLRVGVVGAGRVGAVLGAALRQAGHTVVAASGVSEESVSRIDTLLPGVPNLDPEAVVHAADLVLVTVPDDSLEDLVTGLAAVDAWRPGQIAVHACGRYGTEVLAAAAAKGVLTLAIHPAMTFTGTSLDHTRLVNATFAVSAPAGVLPIALALAVEMGGEPIVIADEDRPAYHAAICHAANHVVTAVTQSSALLARIGVEEPGKLLGPVVHASVEGAVSEAPGAVTMLTGPVVRGDARTVAAHVEALSSEPDIMHAYIAMARATADLALAGGRVGPAQYADLIAALGSAGAATEEGDLP